MRSSTMCLEFLPPARMNILLPLLQGPLHVLVHLRLDLGRDSQTGPTNPTLGVQPVLQVGLKAVKPAPTVCSKINLARHRLDPVLDRERALIGSPQLRANPLDTLRHLRGLIEPATQVDRRASVRPQNPVQTLL